MELKWNREYIIRNTLSDEVIKKLADFEKLAEDEIFVRHPDEKDYFVSQYSRCISVKRNKVYLLGACISGQPDCQYLYYKFSNNSKTKSIGVHRAVADVFTPNFWGKNKKLEAHHLDRNRLNNNVNNLILLTTELHAALHKIKKIVLFEEGKIIEYKNPLDLVYDSNMELQLEDILLANKGKKKPLKKLSGKYTVFDVKGYLLGFQYRSQRNK